MAEALTQKEAAERLGVSPRTLRRHTNRGEISRSDDGSYPWPTVEEEYRALQAPPEPEAPSAPDTSEDEQLTQEEAARRLAITTRQLRRLTEAPRLEGGLYPWPAVRNWYIEFKQEEVLRRRGMDGSASDRFAEARARKTAAEAELKELELAVRRRELIPSSDVVVLVRAPLEAVDRTLRQQPRERARTWAKKLGVKEAEAMVLIEELVEEVRAALRGTFTGSLPPAEKPAPKKPSRKRDPAKKASSRKSATKKPAANKTTRKRPARKAPPKKGKKSA